jgi:hypothetical protein
MAVKDVVQKITSAAPGTAIPVNFNANGSNPITIVVDFTTDTGAGTVTVQFTLDPISNPNPVWFPVTGLTAVTATTVGTINYPVTQVRSDCTVYTSGTIDFRVLQGDNVEN